MPITWVEDSESRKATIVRLGRRGQMTRTRSFKVLGTNDESVLHVAVDTYISATAPTWTFPNQPQVVFTAESYTVDFLGDNAWQVVIQYERNGADNDGQTAPLRRARSFDTTGQTQHVTRADSSGVSAGISPQMKFTSAGAVTINNNDELYTIGWDGEQVHGVDIVAPGLKWTEQYDVPSHYVTSGYIKTTASITGTINSATFRGFAAGEVLFLGCSGQQQSDNQSGDGPWSLGYQFVALPNAGSGQTLPALTVGSCVNIEKRGHDYLWVKYSKQVDGTQLVPRADAVYVARVYRSSNFSLLGIGVT